MDLFIEYGIPFLNSSPEDIVKNGMILLAHLSEMPELIEPWDLPEEIDRWNEMSEAIQLFTETKYLAHDILTFTLHDDQDEPLDELLEETEKALKPIMLKPSWQRTKEGNFVLIHRWKNNSLCKFKDFFGTHRKYTRIMIKNRVAQALIIAFILSIFKPVTMPKGSKFFCYAGLFIEFCHGCGKFFVKKPGSDIRYDSQKCMKRHQKDIKRHEEMLKKNSLLFDPDEVVI
jgi:hypothetical protein